jgi:hypothetical protein
VRVFVKRLPLRGHEARKGGRHEQESSHTKSLKG